MPGNADVHDEALARAAAGGDRDAFGTLFERHLPAVFAAAWLVLHDRAVAAEIARDTFIGAWKHAGAVTPVAFSDSLVASAVHKAHAWLDENPQGLDIANAPITDDPPNIGPVLRARIVTALEVQGIPTKPAGQAPAPQIDLGPSRSAREGLKQRLDGAFGGPRARLATLFGNSRARLGIVGAAAAVLVVGGVVVISNDAGGSSPDDDIETAAGDQPGDNTDKDARDLEWQPMPEDATTTSSAPSSSSSSSIASSVTSEATTPTQPARSRPTTSVTSPPATPAPTTPPTQPPAPPTTAQSTVPTILEFTGYISGKCENGQDRLVMSWKTAQSTWVWVHTEGAVWEDVSGPNGSTSRCTTKGTKWYLEIRRDGDWLEDTATIYA
jgi:RNA polymerase sigma-70 factor (ECF subfamily)